MDKVFFFFFFATNRQHAPQNFLFLFYLPPAFAGHAVYAISAQVLAAAVAGDPFLHVVSAVVNWAAIFNDWGRFARLCASFVPYEPEL